MAYINGNKALSVVQVKYLTPSGTKRITQNGVYDISANDKAIVSVMPSGTITRIDDDGIAYKVDIPTGALHHMLVNKVGGMSYKFNQLAKELNSINWNTYGGTTTYSDGVCTLTASVQNGQIYQSIPMINGHKYYISALIKTTSATTKIQLKYSGAVWASSVASTNWQILQSKFTANANINADFAINDNRTSDWDSIQVKGAVYIDLTDIYGAGNEPTIEEFKATYNKDYYDYTLPTLHHSPVTMVDSNIELLPIPNEVQALSGYGMGVNNTCYNYIDFERKKYVQQVGIVDLSTLDWSELSWYSPTRWSANLPNVKPVESGNVKLPSICSTFETKSGNEATGQVGEMWFYQTGVYCASLTSPTGILCYELETPVETDISAYIDNNLIEIDEYENVEFKNQYSQAVPYSISYQVEEE